MLRKILKFLHEVGAIGVLGAIASCIVLVATAPTQSLAQFAVVRQSIVAVQQWILLPSLLLVLVSGLLSIAANGVFMNAGWAWIKALLGVSMFEGSLLTISSRSREAAELSALAVTGQGDPQLLAEALRTEWGGLWIIGAVSVANIVLAVWRPRLTSSPRVDS